MTSEINNFSSSKSSSAAPSKTEKVVVHVRLRPFSNEELSKISKGKGNSCAVEVFDPASRHVQVRRDHEKKNFYFDSLFDQESVQEQIYAEAGHRVVESVLAGFNGTIFAYGQTGTGKTHTMIGDCNVKSENRGIVTRALEHIFETAEAEKEENSYEIYLAFIQIYMEMIQVCIVKAHSYIRIFSSQTTKK